MGPDRDSRQGDYAIGIRWYDASMSWARAIVLLAQASLLVSAALPVRADSAAENERILARAELAFKRGKRPQGLALLRNAYSRRLDDQALLARLMEALLGDQPCPVGRDLSEAEKLSAKIEEPDDASQRAAYRHVRMLRAVVDACLGQVTSPALEDSLRDARNGDLDARATLPRLGLIYVRARSLHAAERWFAVSYELAPEDLNVGRDYASLLLALGRSHEAARVLSASHRRAPTDLALRRDYAGALTAAGLAEEALALLDVVHEPCAALPACAAQAARIALEAGQPERALTWAEQALEGSRSVVPLLLARGDAFARLGRRDDARSAYQRVLALDPTHNRAKQALATLDRTAAE